MNIGDEDKAKENLLDIGYFRLGFYFFPFEVNYPQKDNRNHQYKEGTLFDNGVKLYYFDFDLRNILARYLTRIEINFRTKIVYTVSNRYNQDPVWFVNSNIVTHKYVQNFDKLVYTDTFKTESVIKQHHRHHSNDKYAPAWKTIEFMSFGAVIVLYRELKDKILQLEIAKSYGFTSIKTFLVYLETVRFVRNCCAHGKVIFDLHLNSRIKSGPIRVTAQNASNLSGAIQVIRYMLGRISTNRVLELDEKLDKLLQNNKVPENVKTIIEQSSGLNIPK